MAARDCDSWGCCNSSKGFIKTKQHHVFQGSAGCYCEWHLSFYESVVRLLYIAILQSHPVGWMTDDALVFLKLDEHTSADASNNIKFVVCSSTADCLCFTGITFPSQSSSAKARLFRIELVILKLTFYSLQLSQSHRLNISRTEPAIGNHITHPH